MTRTTRLVHSRVSRHSDVWGSAVNKTKVLVQQTQLQPQRFKAGSDAEHSFRLILTDAVGGCCCGCWNSSAAAANLDNKQYLIYDIGECRYDIAIWKSKDGI
jgi:hypothetical protein